jgi:hypothetical protein
MLEPSYIAGFMDGDGSISLSKHKNRTTVKRYSYVVECQIAQRFSLNAQTLLKNIAQQYDGAYFEHTTKATTYSNGHLRHICKVTISSSKAIRFLQDITPFLRLKAQQAQIALRFQLRRDKIGVYNRWNLKPKEAWQLDGADYQMMKVLNRKNVRR